MKCQEPVGNMMKHALRCSAWDQLQLVDWWRWTFHNSMAALAVSRASFQHPVTDSSDRSASLNFATCWDRRLAASVEAHGTRSSPSIRVPRSHACFSVYNTNMSGRLHACHTKCIPDTAIVQAQSQHCAARRSSENFNVLLEAISGSTGI